MPHPKNRIKLTGDTHLPDVGYDYGMDDDRDDQVMVVENADIVYADGWVPQTGHSPTQLAGAQAQPQGALQKVEQRAEELPARKPWMAVGAAIALGFLAARMLRRH